MYRLLSLLTIITILAIDLTADELQKAISFPSTWSAQSNENIKWSVDLPECGQSAISVTEDKIFLTVYSKLPDDSKPKNSSDIEGLCYDRNTGKLIWKCSLPGSKEMKPACPYGDSTTPTPITDGMHVWFYNASGSLGCWTVDGKKVWLKEWTPRPIDPYTRRFQPLIHEELIYHIIPEKELRPGEKKLWCFIHASNKMTGEEVWKSEDAITVHNRPSLSKINGVTSLFFGRGGPHGAPEKPYGISMADTKTGKTIWRYDCENSYATVNQVVGKYAYCLVGATHAKAIPKNSIGYMHLINPENGKLVRKIPLTQEIKISEFDSATKRYVQTEKKITLNMVRFTGVFHGSHYWFINSNHSIGRINCENGKIELVEVPTFKDGENLLYGKTSIKNDMLNTRGIFVAGDKRSVLDGWSQGNTRFWPEPQIINNKIFFNSLSGLTYVVDATLENLTEKSIYAINDLGKPGTSWSGNPVTFSNGQIFHRNIKKLYCIQYKEL